MPMSVQAGDLIRFTQGVGSFMAHGKRYMIIRDSSVVCTVDPSPEQLRVAELERGLAGGMAS